MHNQGHLTKSIKLFISRVNVILQEKRNYIYISCIKSDVASKLVYIDLIAEFDPKKASDETFAQLFIFVFCVHLIWLVCNIPAFLTVF